MRIFLTVVILLLVGFVVYAYVKDPAGCKKILDDFGALVVSLPPIKDEINASAARDAASTNTAPETASTNIVPEAASPNTAPVVATPATPALPPNTLIRNGDFSDGSAHWDGDGMTPHAYAAANPSAPADPLTSKGLIVTLNPTSWTRIYQTFLTDKGTQYSIAVTYKLSPNITLSKDAADYSDIGRRIQVPGFERFGPNAFQPGVFYGTLGDPSSNSIALEVYTPTLGSSDVQNYQHTYPPIPVSEGKIFVLAYPPGTGTVVILSVAVTSN